MSAVRQIDYYTYADYVKWPEQPRMELIDGIPYAMAAPGREHGDLSIELSGQIWQFLKGKKCRVYHAPIDVRLFAQPWGRDDTVVQPDIVVVCDVNKLDDKGIKGAPDFIIEILSPQSGKMDCIIKLKKYEQAGVKEYWIVDPSHRLVSVYHLKRGKFDRPIQYGEGDIIAVKTLPGLKIDLATLFPAPPDETENEA